MTSSMNSTRFFNYNHVGDRFHTIDYVTLSLVLAASCGVGVYYGCAITVSGRRRRRQVEQIVRGDELPVHVEQSSPPSLTEEFLLGGRQMSVVPVSLSLFVSWLSAVSFIGDPVEVYHYGVVYWVIGFGYCLALPVVAQVFAPIYFRMRLTSVFEFIESRYTFWFRVFCSVVMGFGMMIALAVVLYAPSLVLSQVSGLDVWLSIVVVGSICTFYTSIGGVRAVIWADTIQFFIMTAGLVAVVVQGFLRLGGPLQVWQTALDSGLFANTDSFNPSPFVRSTFWTYLIGGMFRTLNPYVASQVWVQRYCTLPTLRDVRIAIYLNVPLFLVFVTLFTANGVVLYAFFAKCDPVTSGRVQQSDQMVPLLVLELLDFLPGLPGIYIGTLFSASLSTLSSGQSSLATNGLVDVISPIYRHLRNEDLTDTMSTICARMLSVVLGVINISLSLLLIILKDSSVFQLSMTLANVVLSPISGAFLAAVLLPFLRTTHVLIGCLTSIALSSWLTFGTLLADVRYTRLPVSTSLCPGDYDVSTTNSSSSTDLGMMASFPLMDFMSNGTSQMIFSENTIPNEIYLLSPILYPAIGPLVTITVANLAALLTGTCRWIWSVISRQLNK